MEELSLAAIIDMCQQEITNHGTAWYRNFKRRHRLFKQFRYVEDFISFLNDKSVKNKEGYALKDALLTALITEFQAGRDPAILRSVFIITFYPLLSNIIYPFRYKNLQTNEIVGEAVCALLMAISALKLNPHKKALVASIGKNTKRQFIRWAEQEIVYLNSYAPPEEDSEGVSSLEEKPDIETMLAFLGLLKEEKVINRAEEYLLAGTRIYQRQLQEVVDGQSGNLKKIGYEAAKKRIQRAENRILNYLKNNGLSMSDLKK